ncbi:MAG: twin-arginine translocase TatA/TatE family subunit [Planctomycetes bacterium]|nr:twin-arginine translocase TatA/TatE family subunit [Planctomycetota bacterium]
MGPEPALFSNIGPGELVLIFLVLLLIFGPRLPEVGRSLGIGIKEFKDGIKGESREEKKGGKASESSEASEAKDDEESKRPG